MACPHPARASARVLPLPLGRGGRASSSCLTKCLDDASEDVVQVVADLLVGEAQQREALSLDLAGAGRIVEGCVGVLRAVDLDDQLRGEAEEVGRVGAERYLTAPFRPGETVAAQLPPERFLGRGLVLPQRAGETAGLGRHRGHRGMTTGLCLTRERGARAWPLPLGSGWVRGNRLRPAKEFT